MIRNRLQLLSSLLALVLAGVTSAQSIQLFKGDRIAYIGNNLADRMQHHGWLETYLHALHPNTHLTFRNLGFTGDELRTRPRSQSFGSANAWLSKVGADVIFCFFGYNEALKGPEGLAQFRKDMATTIDEMLSQKYNDKSPPRLVFFSPIAHEDIGSPHLPDGSKNNANLEIYTKAMRDVCADKQVMFVDLFSPTREAYARASKPLTFNGIHLLDHGNKILADIAIRRLVPDSNIADVPSGHIAEIRKAVLEKNYYWFSRYRVVDGYNVYGGRSRLAWHGQSNYDVMQREMAIFDVMTANRDIVIWRACDGKTVKPDDSNIPALLNVQTNRPGPLAGGKYKYLGGEEAIDKMKVAKGMKVNLFASEERFPRLINPVQIAVDTDSRLWASVWPSYPHWNPTKPRQDALVILPDDDGDGKADKLIVFADELNSVTGFEFWGGGVLVCAPPEIWFLKDTDGDDKADVKIRVLQGVSSADTHHSANAAVIGPDGGLYWSRGIFNIANMETPTKTFRSGRSGVYRFDPRTFEINFHFPIGPNPHGDSFDQWGYQFVNDGTSGTGSYVNIGKGVGNKQWFRKRVRPVPANGILSSSHFPEHNNGNFLIANAIGVLGVLQHKVNYNGADITCEEIEPIVLSSDPNFRPSDVEVGGDGALYIADWANALIGHMQHNMRDPNRDDQHGRIYRVTYPGRPLVKPAKMKGKPVAEVCENFLARENSTRYRARLELSGRTQDEINQHVTRFADSLDPLKVSTNRDEAQALLECLWVFEEQRIPNEPLLRRVLQAREEKVRAAAIRTLGHWGDKVEGWKEILHDAARDSSALVRAEAVKAAVSFEGLAAAEVVFSVATGETDPELDNVIKYSRGQLNVDKIVEDAIKSGRKLSVSAELYVLRNASIDDLLKLERNEAVYRAILDRPQANVSQLKEALDGLSKLTKGSQLPMLLSLIDDADKKSKKGSLAGLGQLLVRQPAGQLNSAQTKLKQLAQSGSNSAARQFAYAAMVQGARSSDDAFKMAQRNKESLRDFLEALPKIPDAKVRSELYTKVESLVHKLPEHLRAEGGASLEQRGIRVDYFEPHSPNAAIETLAKRKPNASGIVPEIKMNVPQLKRRDQFTLRFTGNLRIERAGDYRFWTRTDDGSRLYVGTNLVVNNDGDHGPVKKGGQIRLEPGNHKLTVIYFDSGGGDALSVTWAGPGFKEQNIPANRLTVGGSDTVHDVAIRTLEAIPGHEQAKFATLDKVIKSGKNRTAAVNAMLKLSDANWPKESIRPLARELAAYVSEIPANSRTSPAALKAMELTDALASKLPEAEKRKLQAQIADLKINVIKIGTVPHRMIYDKERLVVQAGKPVEFVFTNTDNMPHNFAIVQPGALQEVGVMAEATARDKDAMARQYIPKSNKIMLASRLLQPKETQALTFVAPKKPGIYPYVCTYPGHWRRMYGALYVVADLKQYLANPTEYLADNPLEMHDELLKYNARNTEWTVKALIDMAKPLGEKHVMKPRNHDVGKTVFRVANCVACHKLGGEGQVFGPDLAKLDAKKHTISHILESLIEPSKQIDEKYQNYAFETEDGKRFSGLIVEETPKVVKVIVDPLKSDKPVVIQKSSIEARRKLKTSTMPKGLLNRLSREEILDLIAYVFAGGDGRHPVFKEHKH